MLKPEDIPKNKIELKGMHLDHDFYVVVVKHCRT